ncbi:MAG: hypothetical protein ACRD7E_07335, partial [Bryobacteraceae bacterium]
YQSIEWSPVVKTTTGYVVRHKYRAKNSFGGYVVEERIFQLNAEGTSSAQRHEATGDSDTTAYAAFGCARVRALALADNGHVQVV